MHEAYLAIRADRPEQARKLLAEFAGAPSLNFTSLGFAAVTALRLGDRERASEILRRRIIAEFVETAVRAHPVFYPLLEMHEPRRSSMDLVWPQEAPMIDAVRYRLFRQMRIESGRPAGSDVFHDA